MSEFKHCDDYIDDPAQPDCLRQFLDYARAPAHGALRDGPTPTLFARHNGRLVRVVMASRFGDVGITTRLHNEHGYEKRVGVSDLANFSRDSGSGPKGENSRSEVEGEAPQSGRSESEGIAQPEVHP